MGRAGEITRSRQRRRRPPASRAVAEIPSDENLIARVQSLFEIAGGPAPFTNAFQRADHGAHLIVQKRARRGLNPNDLPVARNIQLVHTDVPRVSREVTRTREEALELARHVTNDSRDRVT